MGIMIMNMSQGKIENDEPMTIEYDEQIMYSEWNPALVLAQHVPEKKHQAFPAELIGVDVEQFLKKMYG